MRELEGSDLNKESEANEVAKPLLTMHKLDTALPKSHELVIMSSFRDQSGLNDPNFFHFDLVSKENQVSTCPAEDINEDSRSAGFESTVANWGRFLSGEAYVWLQERVKPVHWADLYLKYFHQRWTAPLYSLSCSSLPFQEKYFLVRKPQNRNLEYSRWEFGILLKHWMSRYALGTLKAHAQKIKYYLGPKLQCIFPDTFALNKIKHLNDLNGWQQIRLFCSQRNTIKVWLELLLGLKVET